MKTIKQKNDFATVFNNGDFLCNGSEFTKDEMTELISDYKNVNRIYKPIGLLFYTDVVNGKGANWKD